VESYTQAQDLSILKAVILSTTVTFYTRFHRNIFLFPLVEAFFCMLYFSSFAFSNHHPFFATLYSAFLVFQKSSSVRSAAPALQKSYVLSVTRALKA
jgi:hypothetical protein